VIILWFVGSGRTLLPVTVFCINVLQKIPSHIAVLRGSVSHIEAFDCLNEKL
jgi:hypothetical protein